LVCLCSFLQVLLVLEALELENLYGEGAASTANSQSEMKKFLSSEEFSGLGSTFTEEVSEHGPLLLAWATVQQICPPTMDGAMANKRGASIRRLGNRSLQLKVFEFLVQRLEMEPFNGTTVLFTSLYPIWFNSLVEHWSYLQHFTLSGSIYKRSNGTIYFTLPYLVQ